MVKYLDVAQVAEVLSMNARSARKVMNEVGITKVLSKVLIREDAFERYLMDRTRSTFYNRPVAPAKKGRKKNDRVSRKKGIQVGFDEEVS